MSMRVRTKALQGDAVRWDGSDAGELAALAGDRFEGTRASSAFVRGRDGDLIRVRPGDVVVRWDGLDWLIVQSGGSWEAQAEEAG